MMNYIDQIDAHLAEPEWEHWHLKALKRTTVDGEHLWAVYLAYEDEGDPSGLTLVTRDTSLYTALRHMVSVLAGGPAEATWY